MTLSELPGRIYDSCFREFRHRHRTGLVAIGAPDRTSPVLVTGNYTLTVRRLRSALVGQHVWLLVVDSHGINVWCASTGGHLTHHDVISALRSSHLDARVDHRRLILPQLSATGVEGARITEATGWTTQWGPARLEDLASFLARGHRVTKEERFMRFPRGERMEMALMWAFPMIGIGIPLFVYLGGWTVGLTVVLVMAVEVFGLFAALPGLRVTGRVRWATFSLWTLGGFALGGAVLVTVGRGTSGALGLVGVGAVLAMGVLSVDLAGTTPWYGSYINTFRNEASIELVAERCTGAATCVLVCPRDVLAMGTGPVVRKVAVLRPTDCIQCGACIVQCPSDALRFRYGDRRVVEATTIRSTRMNMLGRRTVRVDGGEASPEAPAVLSKRS